MNTDNENFFERVYDVVRKVPEGRVTSYGAIAAYLGLGRAAQTVGWAMNASHALKDVPAHRVVNRDGMLTGKMHFGSKTMMKQLLENEGIKVMHDRVIEFKKVFWDPSAHLQHPPS